MRSSYFSHLECTRCGADLPGDRPQTICPKDGGVLFARYDLGAVASKVDRERLPSGTSMWRYSFLLPSSSPVSLGEGMTPLLHLERLGREMGGERLYLKDEGLNPTATFKARGLSAAVTMAREFGLRELAIPTAGNAGSALAAYAAAAGIRAHIYAPADVPRSNLAEYRYYGADVVLVNGLISDCARQVQAAVRERGWFDVSTTREPYRVEGKKTMGLELAEQFEWELPDAILYPTGGGVGLIGMWKAFDELEALGWIDSRRPRMVAVQATGCAPVVKAWDEQKQAVEFWQGAETIAAGLRVPKPFADYVILDILRRSNGTAIAVTDHEVRDSVRRLSATEGVFAAPEGAAIVAAAARLYADGWLKPSERVMLLNTGAGIKYLDELQKL
jgi:threonine synthase